MTRSALVRAFGQGLAAGVAGTGLMTVWQELAAKLELSPGAEADEPSADPWEDASAPAKVAKRFGEGVLHKRVSADLIPLLTNVMHWGYGTSWGSVYGLGTRGARGTSPLLAGAAFGTSVWVMSYIQLVPMGLYDPPWATPPADLALDLSYHLVYGTGVAATYRLLDRR